ncbi:protein quick-to-court isoform X2 [Drosophila sulfurigaster albostrigata]|uniref:protein quick-to-court isoform X2 n=2 Tax=Drosophila sulfurigaster albostrigata TaxID=89887 RepID=UPI002D21E0F1|nr:protein quick-to-court isoform X2 [Drosophila sulfurigaster albostrigata]
MTSLLPMDTSSKEPKTEQLELELEMESKSLHATPTPTRIPHPTPTSTNDGNGDGGSSEQIVPLRRSASMRLRGTKSSTPQSSCLPAGAFSPRAKLVESSSPSSLRSASVGTHSERRLTRNRSWCNLGQHNTTSKSLQDTSTSTSTAISTAGELALCSDTQCLELTERQQQQESEFNHGLDMSASKSRNMSLQLNGGSAETTGKTNSTSTSTPKTPKTPSTPALNGGASGVHSCVRDSHCARSSSSSSKSLRKPEATATKLSTVPETKISPKTPPVTPDSPSTYLDDDLDSMYSFATTTSGRSTMSCEHPYVARNGTTFSGRKMKYVVHCSNYAGQVGPEYLTPTQRAQRQIRRLKELLCIARQDLEAKDTEIMRLTREVVELRLFKASLSSPEERSASSDAVTVREAELKTSQDVSPIVDMVDEAKCSPRHLARHQQQQQQQHQQLQAMQMSSEMQSSYADSGHFEDLTMSSVHSKDSQTQSEITPEAAASSLENYELQRQELIRMYEQRIEELIRSQDSASSDMKRSHNDKVEALLQKLAECNTRYSDIVPDYEHAKQRIRELEKQLEDLQRKLIEHEEKQNKMYLHMYQQGQEAERISRADQALELAQRQPDSKVSINELLQQLQSTQDELENIRTIYRRLLEAQKNRTHVDPEVTLQFLKSAIFYFLTDKENSQGHLQAIESILEFTDDEKQKINQARSPKTSKIMFYFLVSLNSLFCVLFNLTNLFSILFFVKNNFDKLRRTLLFVLWRQEQRRERKKKE